MARMRFGKGVPPHERYAVAWYQLDVLATAARDVVSSLDQLRNMDMRESFPQPMSVTDCSGSEGEDFWFDFIADTGDGGNATYAVAHTALAPQAGHVEAIADRRDHTSRAGGLSISARGKELFPF